MMYDRALKPYPERSWYRFLPTRKENNFANSEGSQSGGVPFFPIRKSQFLPILRGPILPTRNDPKPEGSVFADEEESFFCQSGAVSFLPIRKGYNFANPEGPFRRGPVFANREGSHNCQLGGS